jgi:nucleoid-associated protein
LSQQRQQSIHASVRGGTLHNVHNAIIHKLVKEKHGKATVVERKVVLPITDPVRKLVSDIHDLYAGRASKGYGRFENDEINYPSASLLRAAFLDKKIDFIDASKKLLGVLKTKASAVALATGGYVLMAHVSNAAKIDWFIVAIINNVDGSVIKDDSLEVVEAAHVDLEHLRVAGRVNLTDWASGDEETRYVGFLKQRGEVADYFKLFLGCNELVADTEETKKLIVVLKGFAKKEKLNQEDEEKFLRSAFDFCFDCNKNDKPLSLETLSNTIWPDNPQKLQEEFVGDDVQISDGFVPDGRSIKSLVKIKSKTQYWSIDLDRHALSSGFARYNTKKGELTLLNLPDTLKAELDHEMKDAN